MSNLIESASAVLLSAERRLESSAQNVANASTQGFKRQVSFIEAVGGLQPKPRLPRLNVLVDFTQGQLTETGSPLDLAIFGPGLFQLRDGENLIYSRGGTFARREDGMLADAAGRVLQQAGGGDLKVHGNTLEILEDGTVLEDGVPGGQISLYEASDPATLKALGGSTFAAIPGSLDEAASSTIRQGFIERSNVVMSDEMVSIIASTRQAETGGRLVQLYDELIGQAITAFSRIAK